MEKERPVENINNNENSEWEELSQAPTEEVETITREQARQEADASPQKEQITSIDQNGLVHTTNSFAEAAELARKLREQD